MSTGSRRRASVLVELGVVEQRSKVVFDGASVTDVARRYGVSHNACLPGSGVMQPMAVSGVVDDRCGRANRNSRS
jgi:hypothetical protein